VRDAGDGAAWPLAFRHSWHGVYMERLRVDVASPPLNLLFRHRQRGRVAEEWEIAEPPPL